MDGRSDWWMAQSSRYLTACPLVDPLPLWKLAECSTVWVASASLLASPWLRCGEWRLQDLTALVDHWKHHCVIEWFSTHPDINLHLGAAGRVPGTFRRFPLRPQVRTADIRDLRSLRLHRIQLQPLLFSRRTCASGSHVDILLYHLLIQRRMNVQRLSGEFSLDQSIWNTAWNSSLARERWPCLQLRRTFHDSEDCSYQRSVVLSRHFPLRLVWQFPNSPSIVVNTSYWYLSSLKQRHGNRRRVYELPLLSVELNLTKANFIREASLLRTANSQCPVCLFTMAVSRPRALSWALTPLTPLILENRPVHERLRERSRSQVSGKKLRSCRRMRTRVNWSIITSFTW